jgi:outer membrane protein TolC
MLGLGQYDEATIASKQQQLAQLRSQRMSVENELARLKGAPPPHAMAVPTATRPAIPAPVSALPAGLKPWHLLVGAGALLLALKMRKGK